MAKLAVGLFGQTACIVGVCTERYAGRRMADSIFFLHKCHSFAKFISSTGGSAFLIFKLNRIYTYALGCT
jgi:hypothetical protein